MTLRSFLVSPGPSPYLESAHSAHRIPPVDRTHRVQCVGPLESYRRVGRRSHRTVLGSPGLAVPLSPPTLPHRGHSGILSALPFLARFRFAHLARPEIPRLHHGPVGYPLPPPPFVRSAPTLALRQVPSPGSLSGTSASTQRRRSGPTWRSGSCPPTSLPRRSLAGFGSWPLTGTERFENSSIVKVCGGGCARLPP